MKTTVLIENSIGNTKADVKAEHGLSVYIETVENTRILFDVGKSDLFLQNAKKLNIDLSKVDYLIISHGHYDHGGGLKHFLAINNTAKIFMHRDATKEHLTKVLGTFPYFIGIDKKITDANKDRIIFVDEQTQITKDIVLLHNFPNDFPRPTGNLSLYERHNGKLQHDDFHHEIALLIHKNEKSVLFTACSHSGVINMYKKAADITQKIDYVLGGFHTYNPTTRKSENKEYLDNLTSELKKTNAIFYTGHCTGSESFHYIKNKLQEKIFPMNTGDIIHL